MKIEKSIKDGKYYCKRCGKAFDSKRQAWGHLAKCRGIKKVIEELGVGEEVGFSQAPQVSTHNHLYSTDSFPEQQNPQKPQPQQNYHQYSIFDFQNSFYSLPTIQGSQNAVHLPDIQERIIQERIKNVQEKIKKMSDREILEEMLIGQVIANQILNYQNAQLREQNIQLQHQNAQLQNIARVLGNHLYHLEEQRQKGGMGMGEMMRDLLTISFCGGLIYLIFKAFGSGGERVGEKAALEVVKKKL